MKRIYIPTRGVEDWQRLLAEPEKQWKTGLARSIAYSWEEAGGFPHEIYKALDDGFPGIVPPYHYSGASSSIARRQSCIAK